MKRVILVRHAKAVPYGYDDDINRKLKDSGKEDAKKVSAKLKEDKVFPDLIISSPAKRAFKTAKIYVETLDYSKKRIHVEEDLYDGMTTSDFIDLLRDLPEKAETVFFFGHNPTFQYLAHNLLRFFNSDMPTCSTVAIDFDIDNWEKVASREGVAAFHLKPREYR